MVAVLEPEAFAGELDPLAAAVDGLVGGDPEVGLEVDGAGDLEDDLERLLDAARLAESPATVVCKLSTNSVLIPTDPSPKNFSSKSHEEFQTKPCKEVT